MIIARVNIYLSARQILQQLHEYSAHYSSRYLTKTYAFVRQINAFSSISIETTHRLVRQHLIFFYLFDNLLSILLEHLYHNSRYLIKTYAFARQIDASSSLSFKRLFNFFDIDLFSSLVMKFFIFAIPIDRTTSISSLLKSLFIYEERLASLLITRVLRYYFDETRRSHFKTVMIVADFSERDNSVNSNDMKCLTCFLRLYTKYYTLESLKKHLHKTSHCSLVIQLQQEVESKNIVENSKIEFSSAFALFVKSLSTYENRLASLDKWRNLDSKNVMIVAEFSDTNIWFMTQCIHCSIEIFDVDKEEESLKEHLRRSSQCSLVLQLEKKISEVIVEVAKFTSVTANIDYFDSTLLCDIQEFDLHHETTSFCQHLQSIQINYREEKLLSLLRECFRDFALTWYKQQSESEIVKKSLSEWLKVLIIAFFAKSSSKFETFTSSASSASFSSQYHSCLNCFAFFSFLTRLLQHNQSICKKVVCKHCERAFESNNKFHEHVCQHHTKSVKNMIIKDASRRNFNREKDKSSTTISQTTTIFSSKLTKTTTKISIFRFVTLSERSRNLSTSFVTSTISKRSSFSIFTYKSISKRVKTTSTTCSLTSFATFSSRLRKSNSKSYLTIDDLIRMFHEKSKSFDLSSHQNHRSSSQSFDTCQFDQSSSSYQFRIIFYFLSTIN